MSRREAEMRFILKFMMKWSVFSSFGENQMRQGGTVYGELPKFWTRHAALSVYSLKKSEEGANTDLCPSFIFLFVN